MPYRLAHTISRLSYALVVLLTTIATGLSCAALLSQAVRTSKTRAWDGNINALIIGASYAIVLVASLLFCIKRRVAVTLRLHRISKSYSILGRGDLPEAVYEYISQEYFRACLVFYEFLPKKADHAGWGMSSDSGLLGTVGSNEAEEQLVHYRRNVLDIIPVIDELAHKIIPTHPHLKPHTPMLHHFRYIKPLLPVDDYGFTSLDYFDSAVQIARISSRELTQVEFALGMAAAYEILSSLEEYRLGLEDSGS